jgi:uncharacterized damage-inducible protein DinB
MTWVVSYCAGAGVSIVDVKKLLEYNDDVRHMYVDALAKLPWNEFVKNREASWHSLRNIVIHTLGAIDYWLDFLRDEKLWTGKDFDDYKSIDDVREYMGHTEERMKAYLSGLTAEGLTKKYEVTDDAGEKTVVTAEDVLIHVEEEVHHRGELIALLWQIDVEPPLMGWKYL